MRKYAFLALILLPMVSFADEDDQVAERGRGDANRFQQNRFQDENHNLERREFNNDVYRRNLVPQYSGNTYIETNPTYVVPENTDQYPYTNTYPQGY